MVIKYTCAAPETIITTLAFVRPPRHASTTPPTHPPPRPHARGRPRRAGGAHLAPRGRAAPGAGALCPRSGLRRGRAIAHAAGTAGLPLATAPGACRVALQSGAAVQRRQAPRRARRRPALQPRAGTCTWHRARQSR